LATYREAEDLINIGAYVHGTNPTIDKAIEKMSDFKAFLMQGTNEKIELEQTLELISQIVG